MEEKRVKEILSDAGAVLTGTHVVYTSGRHGSKYVNKDKVNLKAWLIDELCEGMARLFMGRDIEVVVAPAIGAVDLKTGVSRHLTLMERRPVLGVYAQRAEEVVMKADRIRVLFTAELDHVEGQHITAGASRTIVLEPGCELVIKRPEFELKRGYDKEVFGKRVLVVEDILTTGQSAKRTVQGVEMAGGHVIAVGAICNRGGVTAETLGLATNEALRCLLNVEMDSYDELECPFCRDGVAINTDVGHGKAFLERQREKQSV